MATTLQNGFRKCGIYPCDLNELLARLPHSEFNNSSVEETFIQHLSVKRSETAQPLRNKRKKLHVAPGKSYAHDDSENSCTEQFDDAEDVGSFTDDRDDDCTVSKNGKYLVNYFVLFKYIETLYPGCISSIESDGAVKNHCLS